METSKKETWIVYIAALFGALLAKGLDIFYANDLLDFGNWIKFGIVLIIVWAAIFILITLLNR